MPNFEAIHRKQFKKMESIIDHVARKAERARELTKSTAKSIYIYFINIMFFF